MALTDGQPGPPPDADHGDPDQPRFELLSQQFEDDGPLPRVTVVIPMRNEADHIDDCLESFAGQDYPLDRLDVVVVDGGSTDGSRTIADEWAQVCRWVRVIDNPRNKAAAAFNLGTEHAEGDVVCLFSAHGTAHESYISAAIAALAMTDADGVGGQYHHVGTNRRSQAIGRAMVSPVGMASPHRFAAHRKDVDTISHPAYWRESLISVGPFDERLERNSDYELNYRMREAGMRLVFDPSIESVYRPRPSLGALARQFWWYGRWKERVIRHHPKSLRLRHLVPPLALIGALLTPALLRSRNGRRVAAAGGAAYLGVVVTGVAIARPRQHDADLFTLAAAFPAMHAAWGAGFLTSLIEDTFHD
jgi:succinoglycan biosynthesis protein ExoA